MEILEKLKNSPDPGNVSDLQSMFRDLGYNYADLALNSLKAGSRADADACLSSGC